MIATGRAHRKKRALLDRAFGFFCFIAIVIAGVALASLLVTITQKGISRVNWDFMTSMPSSIATKAGIKAGILGTLWVILLSVAIAVPIGVASAIYLEEFNRRKSRLARLIQTNISNLAGVPSIVYGLLGLALFVRWLDMGRSVLAGSLTMSLLILPMIIIVSQEALKAVPYSYREGALALGSTQWQSIRRQVLPAAMPGILTGVILATSRAIGETAPLITIGAATYISFTPNKLSDPFTVLPIQIFNWTSRPGKGFAEAAAGGIIVLLGLLILLNLAIVILRWRNQAKQA